MQIVFDRLGKRVPIFENEPTLGIWLRLLNNCVLPIRVNVLSDENPNPGTLVAHDVIEGRFSIPIERGQRLPRMKKPAGYELSDIINSREIDPGGELLFSVPVSHVTRRWSLRVEVFLVHAVQSNAPQPRTFVDFDWSGLSGQAKDAADAELFGLRRR